MPHPTLTPNPNKISRSGLPTTKGGNLEVHRRNYVGIQILYGVSL